MTREASIIELGEWLKTPPGQYLVQWEQRQMDRAVADAFGFHALQLGLPQIDGLRANRMPHRWVAIDGQDWPEAMDLPAVDESLATLAPHEALSLRADFDALPFPNQSLDLLVLPHALELARDPHETLREAERVLVPEGQLVITGFNPNSLWGLRQRSTQWRSRFGLGGQLFMPSAGDLIAYRRLRDWLKLLSFEVEIGRFGCWSPAVERQRWLERWAWMDRAGERWWPGLGAVYLVVAVKRMRGMRLVGLTRRLQGKHPATAPAAVSQHQHHRHPHQPPTQHGRKADTA